MKTETCKL